MKKQYYKPEVEVLLVLGNKTLLESPGPVIPGGTTDDPTPIFGGGAPYRY